MRQQDFLTNESLYVEVAIRENILRNVHRVQISHLEIQPFDELKSVKA